VRLTLTDPQETFIEKIGTSTLAACSSQVVYKVAELANTMILSRKCKQHTCYLYLGKCEYTLSLKNQRFSLG